MRRSSLRYILKVSISNAVTGDRNRYSNSTVTALVLYCLPFYSLSNRVNIHCFLDCYSSRFYYRIKDKI